MNRGGSASEPVPGDVSSLLRAWSDGDQLKLALLKPIVHDELPSSGAPLHEARARRSQPADHGPGQRSLPAAGRLQAHALAKPRPFRGLVEHARRHNAKRGARAEHVSLDAEAVMCSDRADDFVSLDDALNALTERAPRKAQVVELRFFGGLSVEETAGVLQVSSITIMREWKSAKAWLYRELTGGNADGPRTLEPCR